jgi:GntR family transcriptional regulator
MGTQNNAVSALPGDEAEPLYQRVMRSIQHDIEAGRLTQGTRLPSERELCERLDVSRVTTRRALAGLVEQGVVEASPGRGWFVAAGPVSEPPNRLLSFSALGRARGLEPTARVVRCETRPASFEEADDLAVAPGAPLFDIERVRLLDGLPVSVDSSLVPLARVPALTSVEWTTASLYAVLRDAGVVPTHADYSVHAESADARIAGLLELPAGGAVLIADQRTYDQDDRPIERGHVVYRGDRYRFRTRLSERP